MTEFDLSKKIEVQKDKFDDGFRDMLLVEDVKEFIRLLKEQLSFSENYGCQNQVIDKLVGNKLNA